MKRMRQLLLFPFSALFVVLTACGGPDIGVTNDEILLGTWAPMTGEFQTVGNIARAMDAYFASVNDAGGIHGRKVRLIIKDDQYNPENTKKAVAELIDEGVFAFIGGVGTNNCLGVKDEIQGRLIPWVNPGSSSPVWTTPMHAYTFSITPSGIKAAQILTRHAFEQLEADKFAVVSQGDSFGSIGQEGARLALRKMDKQATLSLSVEVGGMDFAEEIDELKKAEVETVLLWMLPEQGAAFVNAMTAADFRPQIMGSNVLAVPSMFEMIPDGWDGAIVASSKPAIDSDAPAVVRGKKILAEYAPDLELGELTMAGLAWADLLTEAMRGVGPELKRIYLIGAMESIQNWNDNLLGASITFDDENHLGFDRFRLKRAENGKYAGLTDWLDE